MSLGLEIGVSTSMERTNSLSKPDNWEGEEMRIKKIKITGYPDERVKAFTKGKADNQVWLSPQEFIKAWQGGFKYSGNCESQKKVGWWA